MKITKEPVSAFSIYADKFKQKKKSNPKVVAANGVSKSKKEKNEIANILLYLAKNADEQDSKQNLKIKKKKKSDTKINIKSTESRKIIKLVQNSVGNNKEKNVLDMEALTRRPKIIVKNKQTGSHLQTLNKSNSMKLKNKKQFLSRNNGTELKYSESEQTLNVKKDNTETNTYQSTENQPSRRVKKSKMKNKHMKVDVKKQQLDKVTSNRWTIQENSRLAAKQLFEWLTKPISQEVFMRDYWEKQPLLIQREGNRNYFSELLSTPEIDNMLRKNVLHFTKHLDVTSYTEEGRVTHNLSGRAQANVVWDFYSNGCSVRLLNPQTFIPKIHTLNATLQDYFGCFVGANVYLTPPNSQGFAPHYDDIEAFVLQIEGKKHWKVYLPRNDNETLPRLSSPNFSQNEIGEPFLDVTLEPGDLLYFPRGFIHQASTVEGEHSLHITLSAYQKTAWVDLLEKAIPLALQRAAADDVEFRRGLPRDYLGIEYHGSDTEKKSFLGTAHRLMDRLGHYVSLSLGDGVDLMGAQFMHDALPPVFTPEEKQNSGLGGGLKMKENGKLVNRVQFQMNTKVKLIRANICRLVEEDGEVRLYHCLDNALEYHAEEPQFLVLPLEGVAVITYLTSHYPTYTQLSSLPHDDEDALLALVSDLWDAGLLVTQGLSTVEEDE